MKRHLAIVSITIAFSMALWACDDSKSAPEAVSTTPAATAGAASSDAPRVELDARPAFPTKLGDYTFESWKTKPKSWGTEYSATYKDSSKDELKVVINDAPPAGREEWAVFFKEGKTFKDKPMAIDPKPDKVTMMVRVGDRFRVDFKSRSKDGAFLETTAKDFDFGKVRKLAE